MRPNRHPPRHAAVSACAGVAPMPPVISRPPRTACQTAAGPASAPPGDARATSPATGDEFRGSRSISPAAHSPTAAAARSAAPAPARRASAPPCDQPTRTIPPGGGASPHQGGPMASDDDRQRPCPGRVAARGRVDVGQPGDACSPAGRSRPARGPMKGPSGRGRAVRRSGHHPVRQAGWRAFCTGAGVIAVECIPDARRR